MFTPLKKTFDNPEYLARSRKYDHQCVCDICNCGKHKCPEKSTPFEGQTTNREFYKPYQITTQKRERKQQQPKQIHYDPYIMQTSYNTTFTPHRIAKEKPIVQKSGYQVPKPKFQGESEYKKNYVPTKTKPQRFNTSPSRQYKPNPAKFQDATTYNRQFSPKKAPDSYPTFKRDNAYKPSTIPFQGQSSYGRQFIPHKIEAKRPVTSMSNQYTPSNVKFEGNSRYRQFYQPHAIEARQRCPTEYLPPRPSNCSPGKDHLHFSAEKNKWD